MLDIKYIREHAAEIKDNNTKRRNKVDIDRLIELYDIRSAWKKSIDELRGERNQNSKTKPTPEIIERMKTVGTKLKGIEDRFNESEVEFTDLMMQVPNLTHPDSPVGGEEDFKVLFQKDHPGFAFKPKDHEEILTTLDLIDFERGAKVAAAKFYFAKNDLVRLNQALLNYGIDVVTKHGFILMETPDLARNSVLQGVGFNPRGNETQIYSVENTDLSLIGTAEITVGGYHADEILDLSTGPKKYVALSHCFRTEAGAYGRTSKGLYRVHQFTKLEMFIYCKPEESAALHEELRAIEQEICDGLGLSYRVIDIPSGDLGGPAYRKYDLEAYMTMKGEGDKQGDFGEITSTSNCTDYQARRLNIRYRNEAGATEFVHTLNGTAVVLSRFPIALVEQYQQADGSIKVPEVLQPYLGKAVIN